MATEGTYLETLEETLREIRSVMDRKAKGEDVHLFIPTGLAPWDENGGIERGILTVIGGQSGEGKTTVKLHLATNAAKLGYRVLMVDLEDPKKKTGHKTLANESGINSRNIGTLAIDEFDYERLERALAAAKWAKNIRHATGLIGIEKCMALVNSGTFDLILIDYAQAFPESDEKTLEATIARFAQALQLVAEKTGAAIVLFSQVTKEVERRGYAQFESSKRRDPQACDVRGFCPTGLTDVAWAKRLVDYCKCLLYVWRPNRMAIKLTGSNKMKDNRLMIICGKVNYGEEKDFTFHYDGATSTIRELKEAA